MSDRKALLGGRLHILIMVHGSCGISGKYKMYYVLVKLRLDN